MKRFSLPILTITLSLVESVILWMDLGNHQIPIPTLWAETLIFYVLLTNGLNGLIPVSLPALEFGSRYLFTLVSRFALTIAWMVISGFIAPEAILPNTLFILTNYVLFLGLEVAYLYQRLNGSKKGRKA